MKKPIIDRFWAKVMTEPNSGCWVWVGAMSTSGYGQFRSHLGRLAHRFSYDYFREPIPENKELDHLCRVRSCVNPWHLDIVTRRENLLRGIGTAGINGQKTHCIHGHSLENAYIRPIDNHHPYPARNCRTCKQLQSTKKK